MNIFKKLFIPTSEKQELQVYKTWAVRWTSRYDDYSGSTRCEMELFTTLESAEEFAHQLKDAFALIKHTSGDVVTVKENN